jgi:hypothetical protein
MSRRPASAVKGLSRTETNYSLPQSYEIQLEYFSKYGLTYLVYLPYFSDDGETNEYIYMLQTFNGTPVNVEQHLFEAISKYSYWLINPDSIIISTLTESSSPSKMFAGVLRPFDLSSGFGFWNQNYSKIAILPMFPKKN